MKSISLGSQPLISSVTSVSYLTKFMLYIDVESANVAYKVLTDEFLYDNSLIFSRNFETLDADQGLEVIDNTLSITVIRQSIMYFTEQPYNMFIYSDQIHEIQLDLSCSQTSDIISMTLSTDTPDYVSLNSDTHILTVD